jgi:hypothetical protein
VHHLRAYAAPTDDQSLAHELGDGLSDGRPAEAVRLGDLDLGVEPIARAQIAIGDGRLQGLGQLVVKRNGAAAVDRQVHERSSRLDCHDAIMSIHFADC